jgi:hypothetical protein
MKAILTTTALAIALVASGCTSAPATDVHRPRGYPDRATPEATWETFLWAWRTGDVDAMSGVVSLWLKEDIDRKIEKNGKPAVSDWYRRDADHLSIAFARWAKRTDDLAYLDARFVRPGELPFDVRFSFLRRDDGWTVSGNKPTVIKSDEGKN